MNGPMLSGERVTLRPIEPRDNALLTDWRNSPAVRAGMYDQPKQTAEKQAAWYAAYMDRADEIRWMIDHAGRTVGTCGLTGKRAMEGSAFLAVLIGDADARGKGLAGEALALLCRFGFSNWGLNRITSEVFAPNASARRLYERVGFRYEGSMRQAHFDWNTSEYVDVIVMGLLKGEWEGT